MLLQKQAEIEQDLKKDLESARGIFAKLLESRPADLPSRVLAASLEERDGRPERALEILKDGLNHSSFDPGLHFRIANLMAMLGNGTESEIISHFDAAMLGSIREIKPRMAYAAYLFSIGKYDEAQGRFSDLDRLVVGSRAARSVSFFAYPGIVQRYEGKVVRLWHSSGRVEHRLAAVTLHFNLSELKAHQRNKLSVGATISYKIGFNLRGPIATAVQIVAEGQDSPHQAVLPFAEANGHSA
jgi:tetratricopeptide (TPR) repeat protein